MEEDEYVRSVYEFSTTVEGELPLSVDDVVRVLKRIDKNWLYGSCQGRSGNFPSAFVISLTLPNISSGQKVFAAIGNFSALEYGDLEFTKGDIILGLQQIDNNWWKGRCNDNEGIFPLTHVEDLHVLPKVVQKKMKRQAKVLMDMSAQLEDEIDLFKDDIVYVTEVIDKDWYRGECNGKFGIFPSAFVKLLDVSESENPSQNLISVPLPTKKCTSVFKNIQPAPLNQQNSNQNNESSIKKPRARSFLSEEGSGVLPYGRTLYSFSAEFSNELSFVEGELVKLLRHIDDYWIEGEIDGKVGLFPTTYVDIIVDCVDNKETIKLNSSKRHSCPTFLRNLSEESFSSDTYARVLYDYASDNDQDLTLSEGDTITILRKLNNDWFEAQSDDGTIGFCPVTYVEIIDGYPFSANQTYMPMENVNLPNGIEKLNEVENAFNSFKKIEELPNSPPPLPPKPKTSLYEPSYFSVTSHQSVAPLNLDYFIEQNVKSLWDKSNQNNKSFNNSYKSVDNHGIKKTAVNSARIYPKLNTEAKFHSLDIYDKNHAKYQPFDCEMSSSVKDPRKSIDKLVPHRPAPPIPSNLVKNWNGAIHFNNENEHIYTYLDLESLKKEELTRMGGAAASQGITAEEMRSKRQGKRAKIVEELLQTEKDYLRDIQLCAEAFFGEPTEKCLPPSDLDMDTLFGYLDDVIEISNKLWTSLCDAVNQKSEEEPVIGPCFINLAEDMKQIYGFYCRNHDEVIALLEKHEDNKEIQAYFSDRLQYIRQFSNCFDLGSILIKPVQRILKYPLLLNEILKSTEDGSEDKKHLLNAINAMTDVATAINEFKRRKDLVFKYRKETESSFTNRIARLNLHSMKKMSSRIRARLSSTFGSSSVAKDEQFFEEEKKFKNVEKIMKLFLRNVNYYVEQLKVAISTKLSVAEDIADYYAENMLIEEVMKYQIARRYITTTLWPYFRNIMENRVQVPLNKVLILFHGPNNVIEKRHVKLLDYDSCNQKLEKTKDPTKLKLVKDELEMARKNYEALNAQLLDELPKFSKIALEVFHGCMAEFIQGQKCLLGNILIQIDPLIKLPLLSSKGGPMDNFIVKNNLVVDKLSELSFVPRSFNPNKIDKMDKEKVDKKPKRLSVQFTPASQTIRVTPIVTNTQNDSQRSYVRGKYSDQAYTVVQSYIPTDVMDLAVAEGDVVGIIKKQDPMGNTERWFIDNGMMKGFVPRSILASLRPILEESSTRLLQFDDPLDAAPSSKVLTPLQISTPPPPSHAYDYLPEFYVAMYEFSPNGPHELGLNVNQIVLVLRQSDLEGNPEWWLVEDDDKNKGYVPSNYLARFIG